MLEDETGSGNRTVSPTGCDPAPAVPAIDDNGLVFDGSTAAFGEHSPHMTHDGPAQQEVHLSYSMQQPPFQAPSRGIDHHNNADDIARVGRTNAFPVLDLLAKQPPAAAAARSTRTQVPAMILPEMHQNVDDRSGVHTSLGGSKAESDDKASPEHGKRLELPLLLPKLSVAPQPKELDREAQLEEFLKMIPGSKENLQRLTRNNSANAVCIPPVMGDGVAFTGRLSKNKETFERDRRLLRDNISSDAKNAMAGRLFLPPNTPLSPLLRDPSNLLLHPPRRMTPYLSHSLGFETGNNTGPSQGWNKSSANISHHDYASHFDESKEVVEQLHSIFIQPDDTAKANDAETLANESPRDDYEGKLRMLCPEQDWFPTEPSTPNDSSKEIDDIAKLFEEPNVKSQKDDDPGDGFLKAINVDDSHVDIGSHIRMLRHIHESLYTTADVSSLRTLEKFMVDLLQPDSDFGSLTPHGRLLAFINLAALRRHMFQLTALYQHPEMSVIREILFHNEEGSIRKLLGISEAMANGQLTDEAGNEAIKEIMTSIDRNAYLHNPVSVRKNASKQQMSDSPSTGGRGRPPLSPGLLNLKSNRQLLTTLDELSAMYKSGGEAHFPRFVCGSIDRMTAQMVETLSIPFDKVDRRNIHVQFESYYTDSRSWPVLTYIPHTLGVGLRVQVNSSKQHTAACWTLGTVASVSSGMVMIAVDGSRGTDSARQNVEAGTRGAAAPSSERMFMTRNFVPPNVPSIRIEKAQWRLLPCDLDIERDIYVGSCLSVFDQSLGGYVDMVVLNVFYGRDNNGGIAPVKCPIDETLFDCTSDDTITCDKDSACDLGDSSTDGNNDGDSDNSSSKELPQGNGSLRPTHTCHCRGYTMRVFEGRSLSRRPQRIVLSPLSERKAVTIDICDLSGYKLNYDLQAHFDSQIEGLNAPSSSPNSGSTLCHFQHCVWVVPRHLRKGEIEVGEGLPDRVGSQWFFEPERCLMIFPYNRTIDLLQDSARLISFLHPELNYTALCTGIWSVRGGSKTEPEVQQPSGGDSSVTPDTPSAARNETTSYTRSQKAATRDLKLSEIVNEACSGVVRSPISLVRRLLGCNSVISLWMALDSFDLDNMESSKLTLSVKIPLKPRCSTCGGEVYDTEDITKIVPLFPPALREGGTDPNAGNAASPPVGKDEATREVPMFSDLENTEEVMQRLQNLVACRWRLTREYIASYAVDDELVPLPSRSHHHGNTSPQSRFFFGKSTFINKFVQLMSYVKRSRGYFVDDMLYRRAFQWSDRYFNTRGIEATLMRGWGSFITSKKPIVHPLKPNQMVGPYSYHDATSQLLQFGPYHDRNAKHLPDGKGLALGVAGLQLPLNGTLLADGLAHNRGMGAGANHEAPTGRRRKIGERKNDLSKSRGNTKLNDEGSGGGRGSSLDNERKSQRGKKQRTSRASDNEYCEFKDKEIRYRFVSVVKWDEDLESGNFAT